jgi:lipid-A-disaccharide synthase
METVLSGVDVALACSGTVTTQLAAAGVPTAVLYRLSPLTYAVASRIFQQDYISLVNLSAGRALMPEFLQEATLSDDVPNTLMSWLGSPEERQRLSSALKRETRRMGAGSGSASDRAAEAILEMIALSEAA